MADTKITALTALTGADPANDVIPIVDVSDTTMAASGTTKKISVNNILGASGTATLASATITGDLTVRTNKLKVDATGVAIGATSASYLFDVRGTDATNVLFAGVSKGIRFTQSASTSFITGVDNTGGASYQPLSIGGSALDFSLSGSTAMTLNSTGLGVGVASPSFKLQVVGTSGSLVDFCGSAVAGLQTLVRIRTASANTNGLLIQGNVSNDEMYINNYYNAALSFGTGNTERLRIDSSGNVGIGVTPKSWASGYRALQLGVYSALTDAQGGATYLTNNAYFDSVDSRWEYITNNRVVRYDQDTADGGHKWYSAAAGAVNAAIAWGNPLMTLDASGNLLVGTTGLNGSWNTKLTLSNDSGTTKWAVGPYLGGVTNFLISAGASAGVYLNGTAATSWTSASDERLKDIIEPISNAIAKVGSLRAVIGKFKFDENNTRKPFLIAQDIQAVLPEAVDASNPEKLGVAYTDVIPLLVAAIKELTARVQTLETR